ncbi:MAG: hypothetical protein L0Z62_01650 [Gemmataceae bacterium]|nr:hypothetical protein [Gemmataceae bacterium]
MPEHRAELPPDRERLEGLPQWFDVWQTDARQPAATLPAGAETVRPWAVAVVSRTDGHLLAFELFHEAPTAVQAWQTVCKAMLGPEAGEPHRPTEVQLRREDWAGALGPDLDALNIGCVTAEALNEIDKAFEELGGQLVAHGQPRAARHAWRHGRGGRESLRRRRAFLRAGALAKNWGATNPGRVRALRERPLVRRRDGAGRAGAWPRPV